MNANRNFVIFHLFSPDSQPIYDFWAYSRTPQETRSGIQSIFSEQSGRQRFNMAKKSENIFNKISWGENKEIYNHHGADIPGVPLAYRSSKSLRFLLNYHK